MKLSALHKAKSSRHVTVTLEHEGGPLTLKLRRLSAPEAVALSHRISKVGYEFSKIEAEVDAIKHGSRLLGHDTGDIDKVALASMYLEIEEGLRAIDGVFDEEGEPVTLEQLQKHDLVKTFVDQLGLDGVMSVVGEWLAAHDISAATKKNSRPGPAAATALPARDETPAEPIAKKYVPDTPSSETTRSET
jgi:hypothetical protein